MTAPGALLEQPTQAQPRIINEMAVTFPVLVVEGIETSDGRYIRPGALDYRALPLSVLAQIHNPDGGYGHDAAYINGRLDMIERVPGPSVVSQETGRPFPEGTYVWRGRGVIDADHESAALVKAGFLTGNSVDLVGCEWEFVLLPGEVDEAAADDSAWMLDVWNLPGREEITRGTIAATTLVSIPAFADGYVSLDEQAFAARRDTAVRAMRARPQEHAPAPAFRSVTFAARQDGDDARVVRYASRGAGGAQPVWQLHHEWTGLAVESVDGWEPARAAAALRAFATRPDGTLDGALYGRGFLHRDTTRHPDDIHAYRTPIGALRADDGELVVAVEAVRRYAEVADPEEREALEQITAGHDPEGDDPADTVDTPEGDTPVEEPAATPDLGALTAQLATLVAQLSTAVQSATDREHAALVAELTKG